MWTVELSAEFPGLHKLIPMRTMSCQELTWIDGGREECDLDRQRIKGCDLESRDERENGSWQLAEGDCVVAARGCFYQNAHEH